MSPAKPKVLFIRLSSLGDVILSSAALHSPRYQSWEKHFLTGSEFVSLFVGNHSLHKLHVFERKSGFKKWWQLCRSLKSENFQDIVDLHSSTRTAIIRLHFFVNRILYPSLSSPRFFRLNKSRWRANGFFIFKKFWPTALRPKPFLDRFSKLAGSEKRLLPDMRYLVSSAQPSAKSQSAQLVLGVMPSSNWATKEWPLEHWVELLEFMKDRVKPRLFGTPKDLLALKLAETLTERGIEFENLVGSHSLTTVAGKLQDVDLFLGCDTGLSHLSQALGKKTLVIYGPTHEGAGYPVWGEKSAAIAKNMWCRPCGKTGSACIRISEKQKCLRDLSTLEVLAIVNDRLKS